MNKDTCGLLCLEASCLVVAGYSGRHCIHKSETDLQPPSVPPLAGRYPNSQTGWSLDITLAPQSSVFVGPAQVKVHCSFDQRLLSAFLQWIVFIKRQRRLEMEMRSSVIQLYSSTGLSVEVQICFEIGRFGKLISAACCILVFLVKTNVI